jgi:hypothetical protein
MINNLTSAAVLSIVCGGRNLPGRKHIFQEGRSAGYPLPFQEALFASRKVLPPILHAARSKGVYFSFGATTFREGVSEMKSTAKLS